MRSPRPSTHFWRKRRYRREATDLDLGLVGAGVGDRGAFGDRHLGHGMGATNLGGGCPRSGKLTGTATSGSSDLAVKYIDARLVWLGYLGLHALVGERPGAWIYCAGICAGFDRGYSNRHGVGGIALDREIAIRLLAVDLDGTVINAEGQVSVGVRQALKSAGDHGIRVMLATGRMGASARLYWQDLGLPAGPAVCYNGAAVIDLPGGAYWFWDTLSDTTARRVVQQALAGGYLTQVYVGDELWVSREDPRVRRYVASNHIPVWVRQGEELVNWPTPPIKILIQDEPSALARLRSAMEPWAKDVRLVNSQRDYLEVLSKETGKGRALKKVAERLGLEPCQVAAVGDGENDADMLSWAGLGIAMGQGHPAAKAAANIVAPPIDQDGLATAIHRYVLENEPGALN